MVFYSSLLLFPSSSYCSWVLGSGCRGGPEHDVGGARPRRSHPRPLVGVRKDVRTSISLSINDLYRTNPNYDTRVFSISGTHRGMQLEQLLQVCGPAEECASAGDHRPWTSTESAFVAYVGNRTHVPIVSFSATSPSLSPARTPFFVRATANDSFQAAPIAAFLRAFSWREAVPVYEDSDYGAGLLPSLIDAFSLINARIPYRATRVFVVHTPPALGARLFLRASAVGMMSGGYVWVVTDGIADVLETLDPAAIAAMQGVVGFRPFVNESANLVSRFKSRLRREYPYVDAAGPTVLQLRAYDTARAVATAVQNLKVSTGGRPRFSPYENTEVYNSTDLGRLGVSQAGPALLAAILNTTFDGLAGEFRLVGGQLQVSAYEIVNVVGRSTHTVGYWTPRSGITRSPNPSAVDVNDDDGLGELRTIVWPGDPKAVPEFVNVVVDPATNRTSITGFCIDVFDAVMKKLPYDVPYEYVPFNPSADSYDNLVDVVYNKRFFAAVGDITIVANRSEYVDFTLPYTESGVSMIVAVQEDRGGNMWIFLKPLTAGLWLSSIAFFCFTGFVVWAIEHRGNPEFRGTPSQQLGITFYFAFSTLVYAHREKLESNLSRFVVIIWVFVVLILTSSYTASLTSMLTVQQLQPAVTDIAELLQSGDRIGYQDGSFVFGLLTHQLGFDKNRLINYSTVEEYANALSPGAPANQRVAAIIDEIPYLNLFLSKYCTNYMMAGSTVYKTDGFGFVFPRGSPLVPDISRAILNVTEGSEMTEIEQKWFGDPTTCPSSSNSFSSSSLDFRSFGGLFLITGTVSTLMFLLFLATFVYNEWDQLKASAYENSFWNKLLAWFKHFDRKECTPPTFKTYVDDPQPSPESLSFSSQRPLTTEPSSPCSSRLPDEASVEMVGLISTMNRTLTLCTLSLFMFLSLSLAQQTNKNAIVAFNVGVVLDLNTLVGKMGRMSIAMAIEDFYSIHENYTTRLVIHTKDSDSDDVQAASAALDMLGNQKVQAIVGPQTSSQAVFISDLGNKTQVPIISFTATSPSLSSLRTPYFIRTTSNDSAQVSSIAAIIKAFGWREVVLIYEDTDYGRGIIPYLVDALQGVNTFVPYRSVIPLSATNDEIMEELCKLMSMQTRVFIVHVSFSIIGSLLPKIKEAGMMSQGYAWIMTDGLTNIVDSLDPSIVSSLQGALGVKAYVPKSRDIDNFARRWKRRFQQENPNYQQVELSVSATQAYDTIWALAMAAETTGATNLSFERPQVSKNSTYLETLGVSINGPKLLKTILNSKFRGLSGDFNLIDGQLQYSTFQVINVVGRGSREIGFWTAEHGISRQLIRGNNKTYSALMSDLNPVIWPGESTEVPKGWEITVSGKKLRIGVRNSGYPEFMMVKIDPTTETVTPSGYSIDVFEAAVRRLPYTIPYEYIPFNSGNYDDFVYQVFFRLKFDAVVGDITIRYNRSAYVDFTVPYTESGIAMIVRVKDDINKNAWIFVKPFTIDLWLGSLAFLLYTGFVIWVMEHRINTDFRGPVLPNQLGNMLYFTFATLVFAPREKVEYFLSKIVVIIWVAAVLILKSSYTASLSSMLTVQKLQPTVTSVHDLLENGDYVGYHNGSFVEGLLEQLNFEKSKIRVYNTGDDFVEALSKGSKNGGVTAIIHEIPYIKLFLAQHCTGYTMVGPIYKAEGFGFAFPKGSPLIPDISREILNITEGDTIIQIEKKWIGDQNSCLNEGSVVRSNSLSFRSFWGLFLVTGVASTCFLLIFLIIFFCKNWHKMTSINRNKSFWQQLISWLRYYDESDLNSNNNGRDMLHNPNGRNHVDCTNIEVMPYNHNVKDESSISENSNSNLPHPEEFSIELTNASSEDQSVSIIVTSELSDQAIATS
uniref:Ionotropic glutamate receptor C-terminal domain-containing protein n=1 Tax=Ananas comosus var. bracteatus TaxID=296719 RepID=A0A6V7PAL5_ANACO|nr:unnamed protein product [Ananas comosus var. bracteatus]